MNLIASLLAALASELWTFSQQTLSSCMDHFLSARHPVTLGFLCQQNSIHEDFDNALAMMMWGWVTIILKPFLLLIPASLT